MGGARTVLTDPFRQAFAGKEGVSERVDGAACRQKTNHAHADQQEGTQLGPLPQSDRSPASRPPTGGAQGGKKEEGIDQMYTDDPCACGTGIVGRETEDDQCGTDGGLDQDQNHR